MTYDMRQWSDCAEALAFLGNSLLAPMSQTDALGIDLSFWSGFPDFGDEAVAAALDACRRYARDAQTLSASGGDAVLRASIEYTRLFIGPPYPAVAPWETMYRSDDENSVGGFGQATFEMRELLRAANLEVANENNQYADHIGIELLFASELCSRVAALPDEEARMEVVLRLKRFLGDHPRFWIGALCDAVAHEEPEGYFFGILNLARALLDVLAADFVSAD